MQLRDRFSFSDKPADEYLPWLGHIADDVVLLDDGSHLATIRIDGRPMTLMDDPARYAERRRRHAMLRALADTNVSVYEHHVCHDRVEPFRHGRFRSAYAKALAEAYHSGLDSGLRAREWFLTIVVRPSVFDSVLNRLIRQLEEKATSVIAMLRDYQPVRLGVRWSKGAPFSEIGEAMRLVLYGRCHPVPVSAGSLAGSIYTDRVICGMRGFEVLSPGGSGFGLLWG